MPRRSLLIGIAATVLAAVCARAQGDPAKSPPLAIRGYDPVAYFTPGALTKGSPEFAYDWDGSRYHFSSAANRTLFVSTPDKYAPQYSGNCTGLMGQGKKLEADPANWVVSEGKLYLFSAPVSVNRLDGPEGRDLVRRADANWKAGVK